MNRSAQVGDATQSYEALGGPGISNGCCLDCCGAPPGPIDTAMIEQDGGKWVTLPDGRILEYFVYGSDSADATVLVEISGSGGTAKYFTVGPRIDKMKELNVKGIGITVPGHGFSTVNVGRKIADFPHDVQVVLNAEGVVGKFYVEGTSYGTSHAMAIALHFGKDRVPGMHLQVPYLSKQVREEEKIESKVTGSSLGADVKSLQGCCSWYYFCGASCMCCCMGCCMSTTGEFPDFPDEGKYQLQDLRRSARHSVYGLVFNSGFDNVFDWGFDPREIKLKGEKEVVISYAEDDQESPPAHGAWLVKHFEAYDNKDKKGMGHDTFCERFRTGQQLELFHKQCMSD